MDYFHHVEDPPASTPVLRLDGKPIERAGYFTDLIAEDAIEFVRASKDRPFYLYVPFTAPHAPFQGPKDRRAGPLPADSPLWKQAKAPPEVYAAMIESMDSAVGKIVQELEAQKLTSNTLVIFTSDNGGTASARPAGLNGIKGSTFEGGLRVPCIARWPSVIPAKTVTDQVAITMDLTASMARIAGANPPKDAPFDGIDLLQRVAEKQPAIERTLFWRGRRADTIWRGVRAGNLKFVSKQTGATTAEYLFNLADDLGEKKNLLNEHEADVVHIRRLLKEWEEKVKPTR
jgi:N-acetylgalactosamine-6-sulfatase